jgi:hypothetical protein
MKDKSFKATLICSKGCRHELTWTAEHPASHYGLGVLLDSKGNLFDGGRLHTDPISRIETSDAAKVCGALGIAFPNRQVVEK